MPTTLADLEAQCRSAIDESVAQFWTESELRGWVNDGLRDVARRTETLQSIKQINLVAGVGQYDAPIDQLRIYRVEYRQSSSYIIPLEFRPLASIDEVWYGLGGASGAWPSWWSFWGFPSDQERSQLYVFPIPSQSQANALWVYYYRLPRKLVAPSDPADIPDGWVDAIPNYVEYVARRKDNDRRWKEAFDLYEQQIAQMLSMTRQYSDQAQFVARDTGAGNGAWWANAGGDWW